MRNICVTICRFVMCAWVGAAVLYVITSVSEQVFEGFDSTIKDQLALIRFPHYYMCGFILVGIGLVTGLLGLRRKQRILFLLLTLIAGGLMVFDYNTIYKPLAELITPPGQVRTEKFTRLHTKSKHINQVILMLCMVAAYIASWPVASIKAESSSNAAT